MKTGKDVNKFGLYISDCCALEVPFNSGDVFSRCPRCSSLCDWEMADMTPAEMKTLIGMVKAEEARSGRAVTAGRLNWKNLRLGTSNGVS